MYEWGVNRGCIGKLPRFYANNEIPRITEVQVLNRQFSESVVVPLVEFSTLCEYWRGAVDT